MNTERLLFLHISKIYNSRVSDWFDNKKKSNGNFRQLLQERIDKANPRRKLTAEENKRLNKLEGMADKLRSGENVQSVW